jgi:MPBQ/MSBQ methyltransferase
MDPDSLRARVTAHFSYRGESADIWRGFDAFLDTDSYLNLGYSEWYQPQVLGSGQRRLAGEVGRHLGRALSETDGRRLLDVGCGRGGPALHLESRYGFDVTGIDLVRYNVRQARMNATERDAKARFLVADATHLPLATDSMAAGTAIDSLVYVPERRKALAEMERILASDGFLVISNLVCQSGLGADAKRRVQRFADGWDMPMPATVGTHREMLEDVGFSIKATEDITDHSVGRYRRWTTPFLALLKSPLGRVIARLLRWHGLNPRSIRSQVEAAHHALPYLGHVILMVQPARADS